MTESREAQALSALQDLSSRRSRVTTPLSAADMLAMRDRQQPDTVVRTAFAQGSQGLALQP